MAQVHIEATLEQAATINQALHHWRQIQRWITSAKHSTDQERADAEEEIRIVDSIAKGPDFTIEIERS